MEKPTTMNPNGGDDRSSVGSTHRRNTKMTYSQKRERNDSNAERMIHDNETTDTSGRSMSEPANLLHIFRETNRNGEPVTMTGHTPREKGARPFFEAYGIWVNGHLAAVRGKRGNAEETRRAYTSKLPSMTEDALLGDYSALAKYMHAIIPDNAYDMSHDDLKSAYRSLPEYDDYRGVDMSASDVIELAESKGLEVPDAAGVNDE